MTGAPRRVNRELIFELRKEGLTLKEIGEIVGIKSTYAWKILKNEGEEQGIPNPTEFKQENARKVVEEILENGGRPKEAINKLGLYVSPNTVRKMAKTMRVNLADYVYYKSENFNWIVDTPGTHKADEGKLSLYATCKHCGNQQSMRCYAISEIGGPNCKSCGKRAAHF